jgi:exonuclease III
MSPIKIKLLLSLILNSYGIFLCSLLILRCGDVHPNPGPTFCNKSITLCHANIQSLYLKSETYKRRKIDEIESTLIIGHKIDIVCLSETWLNDNVPDCLVDIKGYKIHRKDRLGHRACGSGMYVTDALPNRRADELEFAGIDLLWVEIHLNYKKILVGACYRPPGQSADEVATFMSLLEDSLDLAFIQNPESIILMGDLNDTCKVWDSDHSKSELGLKLYDYINNHDLHQLIRNPTHILPYYPFTANILDLLITDSPGYIVNNH